MKDLSSWFVLLGVVWLVGKDVGIKSIARFVMAKVKEKRERKERFQKAVSVIAGAIEKYASPIQDSPLLSRNFGVISSHVVDARRELYEFVKNRVMDNICEYEEFFNQLLKMYADELQKIYDKQEEMRREYKSNIIPNHYHTVEIENMIRIEERIEIEIKTAENNFWTLHNILRDLGMRTWGHKSYKAYVMLKKAMSPQMTLPRKH